MGQNASAPTTNSVPAQNTNHGRDQILNQGSGNQNVGGVHMSIAADTSNDHAHKTLWNAIAGVGASHDSEQRDGEKRRSRGECLKGTREELLRDVHEWRRAKHRLPICWLSGALGVGKTAIAMSVASACEKDGLAASFFFLRSDPNRNNPSKLMLTIAYGLASTTESLKSLIFQRIADDPRILEAKLEIQFTELILNPSRDPSANCPDRLVIIDGLDECENEEAQNRILTIISNAYTQTPLSPLRFLFTSRPEPWLHKAFNLRSLHQYTKRIDLNENFRPHSDIEKYYYHHFHEIRTDPERNQTRFPNPWPSKEDFRWLMEKSSSQFIYAATAMKFVGLPYCDPVEQLRTIIHSSSAPRPSESPFSELDELYHVIISVAPADIRAQLTDILSAIVVLRPYIPPSPTLIEAVLADSRKGYVVRTLRSMHSVLQIRGSEDAIELYHTSFEEFLSDSSRSNIDLHAQTNHLASQWTRSLAKSYLDLERYVFITICSDHCDKFPSQTR
ncbi:hypothetical protein AAF712_006623 [Marasmius tenuissimus]|uniref:NACHT domain-containing protein n=1 Tax=Marasmius tenuissimus TaxID=585030 RepID=A0ABR2ZYZ7_9AGAR